MGAMGIYQLFSIGGSTIGGMFNKLAVVPATFWLYYFNVGDFDVAVARVKAGGGEIANGPMEVPGGSWIVQAKDPQGAMFALVGRRG
jgi:predicted enzyme related to lactoylglutathione lyase